MHNVYYYMLAIIAILSSYLDSLVAMKIQISLNLINESMIVETIKESSKLEAESNNDLAFLAINQELLINNITYVLNNNLGFLNPEIKYYFYDSTTLSSCPIGFNYCNSVQLKITLSYKNKTYERILRYEPVEA